MSRTAERPVSRRIIELYEDRAGRARELHSRGRKVIGYLCCYVPLELFTTSGVIPYRIMGRLDQTITEADSYLETIVCPFIRSCFDIALKGDYDFLDGIVMPHSCDTVQRIYDIWKYHKKPAFSHFLNLPHMEDESSKRFYLKELERLKKALEDFTGQTISGRDMQSAIALHNVNRALLRELYSLRRAEPPIISGTDVTRLLVAGNTLPITEYNELVKGLIRELKEAEKPVTTGETRLLVYGSEIDDIALIKLIEDCGAQVVVDDMCTGTRVFWNDVRPKRMKDGSLESLVDRYLCDIVCPRTYRRRLGTREEDLERRFGYLKNFIEEFNVKGVILYIIRFCDTHEFDAPDVMDYLKKLNIPFLHIEDDYSVTTIGQLKTRIQAFLEVIKY